MKDQKRKFKGKLENIYFNKQGEIDHYIFGQITHISCVVVESFSIFLSISLAAVTKPLKNSSLWRSCYLGSWFRKEYHPSPQESSVLRRVRQRFICIPQSYRKGAQITVFSFLLSFESVKCPDI